MFETLLKIGLVELVKIGLVELVKIGLVELVWLDVALGGIVIYLIYRSIKDNLF